MCECDALRPLWHETRDHIKAARTSMLAALEIAERVSGHSYPNLRKAALLALRAVERTAYVVICDGVAHDCGAESTARKPLDS